MNVERRKHMTAKKKSAKKKAPVAAAPVAMIVGPGKEVRNLINEINHAWFDINRIALEELKRFVN
jgi:hypothetical protein